MGHTHRCQLALKKNQVKTPSLVSRVPETGSDPPIGSGRDSGRDNLCLDDLTEDIIDVKDSSTQC